MSNLDFEFLLPLRHQRRRGQHQDAVDDAAQEILLEDHAGLDGLAEPDFVGEQNATAMLFEHLAHGLDLVPEGFDAAQMRQAEQLVEALREAEMGKAFAQAVPNAIAVRRLLHAVQQRREIELGIERNVDLDRRQWRQDGRNRRCRGWRGLRRAFHRALRLSRRARRRTLARGRRVGLENPRVLAAEPCPPLEAAGKNAQSVEPLREPMGFEQRTGRQQPVLLRERQGVEQVPGIDRDVAFAETLEKDLGPCRFLVKQSARSGEQQDMSIAWVRAHRLLGELQKPGTADRIGESVEENPIPCNGRVVAILVRHLFRLIAKGENRLRRRRTRHDRPPPLGPRAERTNQTPKWSSLR